MKLEGVSQASHLDQEPPSIREELWALSDLSVCPVFAPLSLPIPIPQEKDDLGRKRGSPRVLPFCSLRLWVPSWGMR